MVRLNKYVLDVGELELSKPVALVAVLYTDSGSIPFISPEINHTLFTEKPNLARCIGVFDNRLFGSE